MALGLQWNVQIVIVCSLNNDGTRRVCVVFFSCYSSVLFQASPLLVLIRVRRLRRYLRISNLHRWPQKYSRNSWAKWPWSNRHDDGIRIHAVYRLCHSQNQCHSSQYSIEHIQWWIMSILSFRSRFEHNSRVHFRFPLFCGWTSNHPTIQPELCLPLLIGL